MTIKNLTWEDALWVSVADYASTCSWRAGALLAKLMKEHHFTDWERVFVALLEDAIAGFCVLTKTDCIPNLPYTPYISFIFVGEPYRGQSVSKALCFSALEYAKSLGFDKVYLISDHIGLYEKYGFVAIVHKREPWGTMQTIYMRHTGVILQ